MTEQSGNYDRLWSLEDLAGRLQEVVDGVIERCLDVDWSENYLSVRVVQAIRFVLGESSLSITGDFSNWPRFDVEAYKLTGPAERTHGDIAVVVSRSYPESGPTVSGVGFYEAKASSVEGDYYPSFSVQQLRRLVTNTPKLSYLLYDKRSQVADAQEWSTFPERKKHERRHFHVRTIDANLLKQYRSIGEAAYIMGQPFGYHFAYKILSGRDLDYSRPPIETIRRWLRTTRSTSAIVVSIVVQEGEKRLAHPQLLLPDFEELPEVNARHLFPDGKPPFLDIKESDSNVIGISPPPNPGS